MWNMPRPSSPILASREAAAVAAKGGSGVRPPATAPAPRLWQRRRRFITLLGGAVHLRSAAVSVYRQSGK
jgi:hypothetical protein